MKKVIVISDSFKSTLSSTQIGDIAKRVIPEYFPDCVVEAIPVADGGEGTVDCMAKALNAPLVTVPVTGPYGEAVNAKFAIFGQRAIIEMASAAGLPMVGNRLNPARTTTYGVGMLIDHAIANNCTEIYLGLGGSATNDGGCGAAAAMGVKFYNTAGNEFIPVGATLHEIAHIDISAAKAKLDGITITIMCDVTNPLCGPKGAANVFGPQKGADAEMIQMLDAGLKNMAQVISADLGIDVIDMPGAGAAGGMGAGTVALLGGKLTSGIEAILSLVDFDTRIADADLIISGEGRLDSQSLDGKVIDGVAAHTSKQKKPLIVIVGCVGDGAEDIYNRGVSAVFPTNRAGLPFEQLKPRAEQDYEATLRDVMGLLRLGHTGIK